jgi:hypothetical protein
LPLADHAEIPAGDGYVRGMQTRGFGGMLGVGWWPVLGLMLALALPALSVVA